MSEQECVNPAMVETPELWQEKHDQLVREFRRRVRTQDHWDRQVAALASYDRKTVTREDFQSRYGEQPVAGLDMSSAYGLAADMARIMRRWAGSV
jgi:hypothetical protein